MVDGANYAKMVTSPSTANVLSGALWGEKVRVMLDSYTFASASAGAAVNIAKVPKGARYVGVCVNHAALGGTGTIIVGDADDDNRFMTAINVGAAAGQKWGLALVVGYEFTANTIIVLTTALATFTGAINTAFYYTLS